VRPAEIWAAVVVITSATTRLIMRRMVSWITRRPVNCGYWRRTSACALPKSAKFAQRLGLDQPRTQTVIDVMVVVGDGVGEVGQLRLEPRLTTLQEALAERAERVARWPLSSA